jgi:DNA-directed RNA polymerase subunit RPC12/RpoP
MSDEKMLGIVYKCVRCDSEVKSEELELRGGRVKCTICGYRVLKKTRAPIVKRVTAE